MKPTLKQGTKVLFDYQTMKGEATIVGISTTLPFVCPECYIHEYRQ
jgi:hypothetical protein